LAASTIIILFVEMLKLSKKTQFCSKQKFAKEMGEFFGNIKNNLHFLQGMFKMVKLFHEHALKLEITNVPQYLL
jgi:hypothetical protein